MLDFLCAAQPRYVTSDTTPAPLPAPTATGLLDGLGLSSLFMAPTPAYVGQPATAAVASSPGLLCWLFGSPTPHYLTAPPLGTTTTAPLPGTTAAQRRGQSQG